MSMKKIYIIILSLLVFSAVSAQEYISMRPNWTYNTPKAEDTSYEYYVSKGVGKTEKEARKDAFILAAKEAQSRNMAIETNSGEIMSAFQNSSEDFNVIAKNCRIPMREVCQYTEKSRDGKYYYYQLLQVASRGVVDPNFMPYKGDCYDFSKARELRELFREEYEEQLKQEKIEAKKRAEEEKRAAKKQAEEDKKVAKQEKIEAKKKAEEEKKEKRAAKLEAKQQIAEEWAKSRDSYIAWAIGAGYPGCLYASIEYRGGNVVGWGLYGDIGMDYTSISVDGGSNDTGIVTKTFFKYAGGVKFYPYKGIFIDCGYGTIAKPADRVSYNFSWADPTSGIIQHDDRVHIMERAVGNSHGILFHAGYNATVGDEIKFFLGISGGASYDIINKVFAPSVNLKIGMGFDLINKLIP